MKDGDIPQFAPVASAGHVQIEASERETELMLEIRRLRIRHAGATAENNALRENVGLRDSRIRELEAALRDSIPIQKCQAARSHDSARIHGLELAVRAWSERYQALPWRAIRIYHRLRRFVPRRLLFAIGRVWPSHPPQA